MNFSVSTYIASKQTALIDNTYDGDDDNISVLFCANLAAESCCTGFRKTVNQRYQKYCIFSSNISYNFNSVCATPKTLKLCVLFSVNAYLSLKKKETVKNFRCKNFNETDLNSICQMFIYDVVTGRKFVCLFIVQ